MNVDERPAAFRPMPLRRNFPVIKYSCLSSPARRFHFSPPIFHPRPALFLVFLRPRPMSADPRGLVFKPPSFGHWHFVLGICFGFGISDLRSQCCLQQVLLGKQDLPNPAAISVDERSTALPNALRRHFPVSKFSCRSSSFAAINSASFTESRSAARKQNLALGWKRSATGVVARIYDSGGVVIFGTRDRRTNNCRGIWVSVGWLGSSIWGAGRRTGSAGRL